MRESLEFPKPSCVRAFLRPRTGALRLHPQTARSVWTAARSPPLFPSSPAPAARHVYRKSAHEKSQAPPERHSPITRCRAAPTELGWFGGGETINMSALTGLLCSAMSQLRRSRQRFWEEPTNRRDTMSRRGFPWSFISAPIVPLRLDCLVLFRLRLCRAVPLHLGVFALIPFLARRAALRFPIS